MKKIKNYKPSNWIKSKYKMLGRYKNKLEKDIKKIRNKC